MFEDIFNGMFREFEEMEHRMKRMFDHPRDGANTYGYVSYRGPDGVTHTREFGNPGLRLETPGDNAFFADASREGDIVRVVADIPGSSKEDIDLSCTNNSITVSASVRGKTLKRTLALPCDIVPESAKADFNNGVLEVTAEVRDNPSEGHRIEIS